LKLPKPTFVIKRGICPVKDCSKPATEGHHVLYDKHEGGPKIFGLCSEHHSWITRAQSHAGRKQRFPLTVKQRWFFWFKLIKGEMKRPRETHLDRDWSDSGKPNSQF
jgi:hypothetical protein